MKRYRITVELEVDEAPEMESLVDSAEDFAWHLEDRFFGRSDWGKIVVAEVSS